MHISYGIVIHSIFIYIYICTCAQSLSRVRLFAIPWTVACQAPPATEFFRQEYCSGLPFPTLGNLPDTGIEPMSLASPVLAGRFFTSAPHGKPYNIYRYAYIYIYIYLILWPLFLNQLTFVYTGTLVNIRSISDQILEAFPPKSKTRFYPRRLCREIY